MSLIRSRGAIYGMQTECARGYTISVTRMRRRVFSSVVCLVHVCCCVMHRFFCQFLLFFYFFSDFFLCSHHVTTLINIVKRTKDEIDIDLINEKSLISKWMLGERVLFDERNIYLF